MKKMRRLLVFIFTAAMTFTLSVGNVMAATDTVNTIGRTTAYGFQISLYAGEHGTFKSNLSFASMNGSGDATTVRFSNLTGDESFTLAAQQMIDVTAPTIETINGVDITGPEYYVKGFKISGRNNYNDGVSADENIFPALTFAGTDIKDNGDVEYVIAYGIKGDQVKYVVNYVDEDGDVLAPQDTFYGNIGDKPTVIYKYIDGYSPIYKGFTKTLSQNETDNVFTFVYEQIPTQDIEEVITEETVYNTVTVDQGIIVQGATNVTGGGGAGGGTGAGTEETAEGGTEGSEETGIPGIEQADIVDLDDEAVPLAEMDLEETSVDNSTLMTIIYLSLGLLVILAILAGYTAFKKRDTEE